MALYKFLLSLLLLLLWFFVSFVGRGSGEEMPFIGAKIFKINRSLFGVHGNFYTKGNIFLHQSRLENRQQMYLKIITNASEAFWDESQSFEFNYGDFNLQYLHVKAVYKNNNNINNNNNNGWILMMKYTSSSYHMTCISCNY